MSSMITIVTRLRVGGVSPTGCSNVQMSPFTLQASFSPLIPDCSGQSSNVQTRSTTSRVTQKRFTACAYVIKSNIFFGPTRRPPPSSTGPSSSSRLRGSSLSLQSDGLPLVTRKPHWSSVQILSEKCSSINSAGHILCASADTNIGPPSKNTSSRAVMAHSTSQVQSCTILFVPRCRPCPRIRLPTTIREQTRSAYVQHPLCKPCRPRSRILEERYCHLAVLCLARILLTSLHIS